MGNLFTCDMWLALSPSNIVDRNKSLSKSLGTVCWDQSFMLEKNAIHSASSKKHAINRVTTGIYIVEGRNWMKLQKKKYHSSNQLTNIVEINAQYSVTSYIVG